MAKILDLSVYQEETFDIKLLDGSIVKIKKPSQEFLMKLIGFKDSIRNEKDVEEQLGAIKELTLDILNYNKDNRKFTEEDIVDYDFIILKAIFEGYSNFINEVLARKN